MKFLGLRGDTRIGAYFYFIKSAQNDFIGLLLLYTKPRASREALFFFCGGSNASLVVAYTAR